MEKQQYFNDVIGKLLNKYAIFSTPTPIKDQDLKCPECTKKYKTMSSLKKHFQKVHDGLLYKTAPQPSDPKKESVENYSCASLGLCLLAEDFTHTRKHGDSGRILLLYKFMLCHFRVTGKFKYAYQILRFLAQTKCLLSPRLAHQLTWNRFINLKGKPHTNVEMDRVMEHRNKLFKQECRSFHGKVTGKSIARVGQAADSLNHILYCADKAANVKKPPGQHKKVTAKDDVIALAALMHKEQIFSHKAGRKLHSFPDFMNKSPFPA